MAAQKHRLQFTDANGKKVANAGFQGKLLTDAEKAKNRSIRKERRVRMCC